MLWSSGGNFLEVLPDRRRSRRRSTGVPLRVHQDVVVSTQMLVDGDDVILLPVATRYEQEGGGTETTTERRIVFSPAAPAGRRGPQRVALFADVATRVRPDLASAFSWATNQALRAEIAEIVPTTRDRGPGHHRGSGAVGRPPPLRRRHLPHADGRGSLHAAHADGAEPPRWRFTVATRRGKQFNSMIHGEVDPLTGAHPSSGLHRRGRRRRAGWGRGHWVRLSSDAGTLDGRLKLVRLPSHSLQVHWPEGNVLIGGAATDREPRSKVPDYNAVVRLDSSTTRGSFRPTATLGAMPEALVPTVGWGSCTCSAKPVRSPRATPSLLP